MDVVVVGSCNIDLSSYVSRLPKEGETLTGYKFETGFGGKGANQCIAAVKLGAKVAMIGKIGNDVFGEQFLQNLRACNVNCDHMGIIEDVSTGVAAISVTDSGSNSIIVVPGANNKLSVVDIEGAEFTIKTAKVLVCQNEVPQEVSLAALKLARKHGVKTVFNPAPAQNNFHPELFTVPDIFCPNETEAELLTGKPVHSSETAFAACKVLMSKGCNSVIITLGEKGAVYQKSKITEPVHIPTTAVRAVDTTGAGDSFIGSLIFFLATRPHLSADDIILRAEKIAAISVTKQGTQKSFPEATELPSDILV